MVLYWILLAELKTPHKCRKGGSLRSNYKFSQHRL
jgi:hypothetical protein